MKKKIAIVTVILLLMQIFCCFVYAASAEAPSIQPYYTGVRTVSSTLSVENESTGYACCFGTITMRSGYTADMTMTLVRVESNGSEYTMDTWYQEDATYPYMEYYRFLMKNYTYYLRVDGDIYDANGNYVEHVDVTDTIYYGN